MKKIKEVIVVEGKDDTKRIQEAVNADTIETRGSAIPAETLKLIEKVAKTRGIIIFTDPDFSGEKIRKIVSQAVPNAKHAFIKKSQGVPKRHLGSLGVEHASPQAIRDALKNVYTEDDSAPEMISLSELRKLGLMGDPKSKDKRKAVGEILNIGYVNAKQMIHRLRMFGISKEQLLKAVEQIDQEDKND